MLTVDQVVGANIKTRREDLHISFREMSVRLTELGAPVFYNVIPKIEAGERPVRAAELIAFARVLGTTPNMLLLPNVGPDDPTGAPYNNEPGAEAWAWLSGSTPLGEAIDGPEGTVAVDDFRRQAMPEWEWVTHSHPAVRAARDVARQVAMAVREPRLDVSSVLAEVARIRIQKQLVAELDALPYDEAAVRRTFAVQAEQERRIAQAEREAKRSAAATKRKRKANDDAR